MKNDVAKQEVINKLVSLVHEYNRITDEISKHNAEIVVLQKRLSQIKAGSDDCYAAARLFNFDLLAEYNKKREISAQLHTGIETNKRIIQKEKSVRELVFEEAQKAYPKPVRATDLRIKIEQARKERLHEKTVGMTLYRLLKDGFLRRDKKDWFYLSKEEKPQHSEEGAN